MYCQPFHAIENKNIENADAKEIKDFIFRFSLYKASINSHTIKIGKKTLNISVSNHPGTVLSMYKGDKTTKIPAVNPAASSENLLTNIYVITPANGAIKAGNQKQTVKRGILVK